MIESILIELNRDFPSVFIGGRKDCTPMALIQSGNQRIHHQKGSFHGGRIAFLYLLSANQKIYIMNKKNKWDIRLNHAVVSCGDISSGKNIYI